MKWSTAMAGYAPPWVPVMEAVRAIGPEELSRRAASLNRQVRLAAPFGAVTTHHYDPLPAPLTATEFAGLESGLRQRATFLNALLEDLYGRQSVLHEGRIPAALVLGKAEFLRSLHTAAPLPYPRLSLYAADLIRGQDGRFQVLRDHTGIIPGLGHALTLRRVATTLLPELFRAGGLRSLRPAREMLVDHLQRESQSGLIAVLSAGISSPAEAVDMMDDALLARALGVLLIEPGDLAAAQRRLAHQNPERPAACRDPDPRPLRRRARPAGTGFPARRRHPRRLRRDPRRRAQHPQRARQFAGRKPGFAALFR